MSKWLNNKQPIHQPGKKSKIVLEDKTHYYLITKPCHKLGYCPYGQLVEEYPINDKTNMSCLTFGHDCPVFYLAEPISE